MENSPPGRWDDVARKQDFALLRTDLHEQFADLETWLLRLMVATILGSCVLAAILVRLTA